MSLQPLFSIIILHYNQEDFLKSSIDSILMQTYNNFEILVADDSTPNMDIEGLVKYVEEKTERNLQRFKILQTPQNSGTVKNLNNAIREAKGEYLTVIAADDQLFSEDVLTNYAQEFLKISQDCQVVAAQCYMYDEDLKKLKYKFINEEMAKENALLRGREVYRQIAFETKYAMGATAFKMSIFEEIGFFDESYKMIEDWSYYLKITRSGKVVSYLDKVALKHRDGGVSNYPKGKYPQHVLEYYNDLVLIQEKEILPYLKMFSPEERTKLFHKYLYERKTYGEILNRQGHISRISLFFKYPLISAKHGIKKTIISSPTIFKKSLQGLLVLWVLWISLKILESSKGAEVVFSVMGFVGLLALVSGVFSIGYLGRKIITKFFSHRI